MSTDKFFGVLDGINVINTIIADTKEIAELVTGKNCIEYDLAKPAVVGGTYNEEFNIFVPPSPYPSWIFNYEEYSWKAPIAYPEITEENKDLSYEWNESTLSWEEVVSE